MKKRDGAREMAKTLSANEKVIWLNKYRKLRNKVISKIRQESKDYNNNRIDNAGNENEVWNIARDIINAKKDKEE